MSDLLTPLRTLGDAARHLGDDRLVSGLRLLYQRVREPQAFVCVVGETSTGKSTLINALLGRELLPTDAAPTTGTVTHLLCNSGVAESRQAVFRDATVEQLENERFEELCRRPPEGLLKLQAHTSAAGPSYDGLNVFDTPGFNAIIAEHEEVLRSVLPQADVVVLTAGYRSGFGQSDQDLYDVVRESIKEDDEFPVFIAINRVPPHVGDGDRRVREILHNAEDCIRRPFSHLMVRTVMPSDGVAGGLPETDALWTSVIKAARSAERVEAVDRKLRIQLCELAEALLAAAELRILVARSDADTLERQRLVLEDGRKRSHAAVDACMERLNVTLPAQVRRGARSAKPRLHSQIDDSGKWLGQADCQAWIAEHAVPHEVRVVCASVEESLLAALDELNRELADIANTTIQAVEREAHLADLAAVELAKRLAGGVAKGLAGRAVAAQFRALGGVGGVAAGAGNAVKMVVKRVGLLFDKTFPRHIYDAIGRAFTKRTVQALGVAFAAVIEVGAIVYDAHVWKKKLKKNVEEAIDEWQEELSKNLLPSHLNEVDQLNRQSISTLYDDMLAGLSPATASMSDLEVAELESTCERLRSVQTTLQGDLRDSNR